MTRFGKYLDRSMKDLSREAIQTALQVAGIEHSALQAAVVGNAMAGLITGQECVRGQVVLREMGIGGIPVVNTENACASSATAFHLAWLYVASGLYDVVLALGMEKLYHEDKSRSFQAIGSAVDVELMQQIVAAMKAQQATAEKKPGEPGKSRSMFMDFYAQFARAHMEKYGTTKEQFAKIAVKNHYNGSLNPHAQYQHACTLEEVLASPVVAEPLTRLMCSPIGDGAAAVVLASAERARQLTAKPVRVRASVLVSGEDPEPGKPGVTTRAAQRAYEAAGLGPEDIDVAEVHDASAPAELVIYEELGFCAPGDGVIGPAAGEHERRVIGEGASGGCHWCGADLRDLLATARRSRHASSGGRQSGADGKWRRDGAQRSRRPVGAHPFGVTRITSPIDFAAQVCYRRSRHPTRCRAHRSRREGNPSWPERRSR